MKKTLIYIIIICFLAGCAGRTPRPINTMNPDDRTKSCEILQNEIVMINNEISRLTPEADKTAYNVGLGIAGWFLIIPWFFMDLKNAEKHELEAYRQRLNNLNLIYMNRKCT